MLFTIQYLKTSIILPLTLKEAKLEWLHDTSFGQGEMTGQKLENLNSALLEFQNADRSNDSEDHSTFEILKKFDGVIEKIKIELQR